MYQGSTTGGLMRVFRGFFFYYIDEILISQVIKENLTLTETKREFVERGFKTNDYLAISNQDRGMCKDLNRNLTNLLVELASVHINFGFAVCNYVANRVKHNRLDELEYVLGNDFKFGGSNVRRGLNG